MGKRKNCYKTDGKKPVEEMGYKVETEEDIKTRKEEWEKGKATEFSKKGVEEMGYKVETDDDIKKRKDEWEKGKKVEVQKKTFRRFGI